MIIVWRRRFLIGIWNRGGVIKMFDRVIQTQDLSLDSCGTVDIRPYFAINMAQGHTCGAIIGFLDTCSGVASVMHEF